MARFQFRLKSLLAVRQNERDQCRSLLEDALDRQRNLDAERDAVESEICEQRNRSRACARPGPLDVASLASTQRYASLLRLQLAALDERRQALAADVEGRRQALTEADRDLRALEKLRERRHQQFRALEARADGKQMDEIASRAAHGDASF